MTTTSQRPIGSPFTAASTAHEVVEGIDLTGKVAIVTGGHSGIGLETTRALAGAGATVVVPVRDPDRARPLLAGIDRVEIDRVDLLDPASVDRFAGGFLASGRPAHILVNSAGIMGIPLTRDARGYEYHFATNHLGHFQLTQRLWPALERAQGARVVSVSAWAHRMSPIHFDDLNFARRPYEGMLGYAQSKTANILFAVELDRRGSEHGIRAFSLHPGSIIETNLSPWATDEMRRTMGLIDDAGNAIIAPETGRKNPQQGASTSVWCATSRLLDGLGGLYCENNEVSPLVSLPPEAELRALRDTWPVGVVRHAIDPEIARRLWTVSEELTGARR